jgi:hypothetical protein
MTTNIGFGWTTSTAGDSLAFGLALAADPVGAWTNLYALGNATTVLKGATPYIVKTDIATSSHLPLPYLRLYCVSKGGTLNGETVVVTFPFFNY